MPLSRSARKWTALLIAGGAVAVGAGAQAIASGPDAHPASASTDNRGNPNAVPPVLRAATPSELAQIRSDEGWERQKFYYRPPAGARYSSAVLHPVRRSESWRTLTIGAPRAAGDR